LEFGVLFGAELFLEIFPVYPLIFLIKEIVLNRIGQVIGRCKSLLKIVLKSLPLLLPTIPHRE
jgi:hypothetical protein